MKITCCVLEWGFGEVGIVIIVTVLLILSIRFYLKRKENKKMPQGLQIFDTNGNEIVSIDTPNIFMFGEGYTGTQSGVLYDDKIDPDKTFIYVYKSRRGTIATGEIAENDGIEYSDGTMPLDWYGNPIVWEINNGSISWSWKSLGGNLVLANDKYVTVCWFVYGGIYK